MPVTLLFGVHAHQPVGNFQTVMADAHERCYRPFLETLFEYPEFRFSAHFSGWLLDWLRPFSYTHLDVYKRQEYFPSDPLDQYGQGGW